MKNKLHIKKLINVFSITIIIFIVSFFVSFVTYNFNILKLKKEDRIIKKINPSNIQYKDNKIIINYKGYINKLNIYYKTNENVEFDINYKAKNFYNIYQNITQTDNFTNKFHNNIIPIKKNINKLIITNKNKSPITIESIEINNTIGYNIYLWFFIFISILIVVGLFSYNKKYLFKGKIENLFLFLALTIGSLFIILQPCTTSYSWDDQIHFSSIYKIFELDGTTEWTQGYMYMRDIYPFGQSIDTYEERNTQDNYLNKKNKVIQTEANSPLITYNQIGYIIPGFVLKMCSKLNLKTVPTFLITKVSMLLSYSIIMYYSIKIIPRGKRILSVIGLFPTSIFLSTQFSYDPPIIACISLFIAKFISILEDKNEKLNLKNCLILLCSIIVASFIKAIYIPLILLLLFIPRQKFITESSQKIFKIGVVLLFILITMTFVLPNIAGGDELGDLRGGNTSTSGQIQMVLKHPVGYATLLKDTTGYKFSEMLIGEKTIDNYAYVDAAKERSKNTYYALLFTFIFVVLTDSYREKTKKTRNDIIIKITNIILNLGTIILIWTALYVSFTPVGETTINGVQGRYFIPLIPPIALITFSNNKIKTSFNQIKYDTLVMCIISLTLLFTLYSNFYTAFCL